MHKTGLIILLHRIFERRVFSCYIHAASEHKKKCRYSQVQVKSVGTTFSSLS